jgi:hypothetical protein
MGFMENEFYRTPMEESEEEWMKKHVYDVVTSSLANRKRNDPTTEDEHFRTISGEYYEYLHNILAEKQQDYGPLNISLAPGGPINGLLVRMNDKLQRLINLTYNSGETPNNEAVADSYADLANYCVISMMVLDGVWKGVPEEYLP